jgi:hypothetical protein
MQLVVLAGKTQLHGVGIESPCGLYKTFITVRFQPPDIIIVPYRFKFHVQVSDSVSNSETTALISKNQQH